MNFSGRRTVHFLGNLIPLLTHDYVENIACARSLHDGTLIRPMEAADQFDRDSDEWVTIWWQGDRNRSSDVLAGIAAANLINEFVQLQSLGKPPEYAKHLLILLSRHYHRKTGQNIFLRDDASVLCAVVEDAKRYWPDRVWDLLRK
ncbi:hypothetical protein HN51_11185 [Ectopseudomonas mendocina]|uniref:Uncharacterized protein n=1 Tax=Ectopseudomonas mendocina S5.2 TaxID=1225174 RepID=A0ABM5VVA9_ECTME|nr:hypothetical protein DW68_009015 [Pseudomonas mendocina S5.2]KES00381.1 hypothetical protein HN51_11185 [Pseudomonas mendocina]